MPLKTSCSVDHLFKRSPNLLSKGLKIGAGCLVVLWPVVVFLGHDHLNDWSLLLMGMTLLAWRAPGARVPALITVLLLFAIGVFGQADWGMKTYPVAINALLLLLFLSSLFSGQTTIEKLARIREPNLPPSGVAYTRRVTKAWCVFFLINGSLSAWTVWKGDMGLWALYNGLISYLLMAAMFSGEWIIRQFHLRRAA